MIVIVGLVYAVIYYFVFSLLIKRFDFKTPGREDDDVDSFKEAQTAAAQGAGQGPQAAGSAGQGAGAGKKARKRR